MEARCVIMWRSGDNMIRTQISLDDQDYELARREAADLGISFAELVRRALRRVLPTPREPAWMRYAGCVQSGDAHSSETIDDVVYGAKD